MSFGWSVGDLVATIGILIKVSNALRDSDEAAAINREDNLFIGSLAATLEKNPPGIGRWLATCRNDDLSQRNPRPDKGDAEEA